MSLDIKIEKKILNLITHLNKKEYDLVINKAKKLIESGDNFAILYDLIGVSYSFTGEDKKAVESYNLALTLEPNNEETFRNLGKSLRKIERQSDASKAFKKSIKLKPNNPDAYFNLGLIDLDQQNYLDGIKNFEQSLKYNNKFFQSYYNLGIIYNLIGDIEKSEYYYLQCIDINTEHIKALNNLATLYIHSKKNVEAIKFLKKCIQIDPHYTHALTNMGVVLQDQNKFSEALNFYEKAIKIDANFVRAIAQKLFIKRKLCDWSNFQEDSEDLNLINVSKIDVTPWQLLSFDDDPKNEFLRAAKYANNFKTLSKKKQIFYKNKKIKIGYFTPDFHNHAGMMNMEGLFKYYDKSKFQIIGFDYGYNNNDETHHRIKNYFDDFFYVANLSDYEIAQLAIKNKIDIAIHRNGFSQKSRSKIFSYNPAVLQINFLGYPGTTALEFIDYIIADKIVMPKENCKFFSEKIIFMPNSYYPTFNERVVSDKIFTRSNIGIPENAFVLCCFNNSYKITFEELSVWMNVMKKHKNTYLILLISEKVARNNLLEKFLENKIDTKRLIFFDYINIGDHLSRHSLANLSLDTFNYNGHTTAVDSLLAGLPIVTKIGKSFSSRVCASILNAHDLPELITKNKKDYYNLISKLISDQVFYEKILNKTKKNFKKSNLFNTKKYVKDFENGLEKALDYKINKKIVNNIELKELNL